MQNLIVHDVIAQTEQLFELQLDRANVAFEPGNCLALFNNNEESRPYSIASGTDDELLRFLIRRVPEGPVSQWLTERKPGDMVQASEPFGWFQPGRSESEEQSVFIATGTGIAPFLSYLRTMPQQPPQACFYGVSLAAEAFALDELKALPNFQLAVSRETANGDFHGRVTGLMEQLPLESNIHYYLCGLDEMIDEVSGWLEQKNIDYTHIHREVFFYADAT